ncbi:unnamed protein product, partial [Symbiodinium sp. KB8]
MASYTESEPVFTSRCEAVGLPSEAVTKLKDSGINTLAKVAFVSSYAPGASSDAELIKVLDEALGSPSDAGQKASWRRLFHEAYAVATQELKAMAERPDEAGPRKLSQPERAERYRKIKASVTGIDIRERNEPSDALLDLCVGIYEGNRLKYVAWDRCTSKSQELASDAKKDNMLTLDAQGRLKTESKSDSIRADTSSEIMLQFALLRRGLAFEMANLLDFKLHRRWAEKLIETRMTAQSESHSQVTFSQLEAADRRLFLELADRSRDGVQAGPLGRPLDDVFEDVTNLPDVVHLMQPLPKGTGSGKVVDPPRPRFTPYDRSPKGGRKGKGTGRGTPRMPRELVGCRACTNKGEAICFGYGLKTCTEQVKNGRCSRGLHVCAVPKCGLTHPALDCPHYASLKKGGAKRPAPGSTEESIASSSFDKPDRSTEESIASSSFDKPANAELEAFSCTGPEQFSAAAASKFNFEMPDLVSLCDLLTSEIPARGGGSGDEFAWSTGAYVHGGFQVVSPGRSVYDSVPFQGVSLLRDSANPWGVPECSSLDSARLQSANRIFIQLASFCDLARKLGIPFTVEHPCDSWLWRLPPFLELRDALSSSVVQLGFCGSRIAKAAILSTAPFLKELCVSPGQGPGRNTDQHKLFCLHFADLLKSSSGVQPALPLPSLSEVRAAAHAQPKVSKRPPLIPEFEYTQRIRCTAAPPLNDKNQLKIAWQGVPAKARLLRSFVCKGGDPASQQQSEVRELIFGVFREPVKFVYQAIALQHPFDSARAIPDRILRVLFATLTRGPLVVMKDRLRTLQTWTSWAKELESAEIALHASLHPSVQKVLKGKRLLLLNRIAESLEWPDRNLHRDLCKGFDLSGVLEPTGVFEPDHKPPCASIEQFWDAADVLKGQLWDRVKSQRPQDYDEAVSEITNGETDAPGGKGWLEGPFSWSELESRFNGQWMPCRRFAVWQGKWRAIDDLSESGLNSTFGCHEKIPLRALDEIIWICTRIMQAAAARGEVTFTLSSGQVLRGKLHSFWHDREKIRPVSTTFDLKSAYKQFPLSPSEQCKAVIIVKHPGQSEPVGYVCRTLPFGARGSVLHFNRVSTLLQRILHEVNVLTSLYYDDYPVVTPAFLSANTASIFGSVMRLLGFKIADDKDKPFSSQSETLGVVVDTSDDELRCVRVSNKKSRSDGIATAIDEVMTKGSASPKELPSLFGRLQFAEAQILGRMGRLALHDLRELERSSAAQ